MITRPTPSSQVATPPRRYEVRAPIVEAVGTQLSQERQDRRRASVPPLRFPESLPVSQRKDDIAAAIRSSQVVVIAGETGSGKTTQIPKICLELGRGVAGLIGHTQPRRLAARSVAERIAEELGTPLGTTVGYTVRFHDQVGEDTLVKLMTDGILLAEITRDRMLSAYDTIIIDEAHERSLNIDFLLGYLKQLLPKRPDLKLIITSATIDPGRFSDHFAGAPVVEVSGRSFPVEIRYSPYLDEDSDQVTAIVGAVAELSDEGPGDVLVFLSGEREIRDTADALRAAVPEGTEVLPLFARLSAAEQHRVFAPHPGRRIVLATNVAETSLTVPGIRYVVDPGTARISRYSQRTKVQRLPIERISQASATQRAGRCGRVAPGICIRLYEEDDLLGRPEFTDPEILRTNLASVILQMTALGLGDVAAFPFVDPPDRRNIKDGVDLLHELGALDVRSDDSRRRLTPLGRTLSGLPLDPRLGRMVVEADRNGCVRDVLVIAAALSIQDPRERPADRQQAAAEMHKRFADETSDFQAYLNLWRYLQDQQKELSSSAFRRLCKKEFLNYLRVREWQDLHSQLRRSLKRLDLSLDSSTPSADTISRSLLAGLLSHIGLRDVEKREYVGARGARWALVPGSALAKKAPRWVMAAELVETNRMWGRVAGRIDPSWAEELGAHLVKRSYSEPRWMRSQASVMADERVTLYGVPLVEKRQVSFGRVAPVLSRELFLQHALVEGDWDTNHAFFAANRELLDDVEELEHRARRRDLVVDDATLYAFYDARVPADVVSGRHFDSWWKAARRETPDLLTFSMADLVSGEAAALSALDHPDVWVDGDLRLPLTYQFEPGSDADGVTVHIPIDVLNRVSAEGFDWQVPGLRQELVTALIKSLPKPLRVRCVPAPDTAAALLTVIEPRSRPLLEALEIELLNTRRVDVRAEDWQLDRVPAHLRMTFRVEGEGGRTLAEGKDLAAIREQLRPAVQQAISSASGGIERSGLTDWEVGTLPRQVRQGTVQGFPALVDEGATVGVRVMGTALEQQRAMWLGTRRLLQLTLPSPARALSGRLPNASKLALAQNPAGNVAETLQDCTTAALDALMAGAGGPAWDAEGFVALRGSVRPQLLPAVEEVLATVTKVLGLWSAVRTRLDAETRPPLEGSVADMRAQLDRLVGPGFVTRTGRDRLPDVLRSLQAMQARLDRLPADPARDRLNTAQVAHVTAEVDDALRRLEAVGRADTPEAQQLRWMVEELRISLFAPPMRTRYPVSEKRIFRAIDAVLP
ncbi:MAG: ATP-dependent helicase HrpA [Frankiales bacterium]|nr:ATP-dependent helicase HrpA [Frankiales bacterium]